MNSYYNMMGSYNSMMIGGYGGGMMAFGWLTSLVVLVLAVLCIVALWKYINKK